MAQTKLPLKIRSDIRDLFEAPASALQKEFKALEGVIGLKVSCNPEWDMLWTELGPKFLDKATFVPNIGGVIAAWCSVLGTRLEDDKFTEWTEDLVGRLESVRSVKLHVQVSDDLRAKTAWLTQSSTFAISLPREIVVAPHMVSSSFETDFESLFSADSAPGLGRDTTGKDDEWANVDETGEAQSISIRFKETAPAPDTLPAVDTLPRPDILFRTLTPYLLNVTLHSTNKLVVQGTHEPSLQLLSDYLQRWMKRDHRDVRKVPLLRATLGESNFGLGLSYDTLTIEPHDHHQRYVEVNPTIVLAFVEGVLGYRLAHTAGSSWEYRREVAFKREPQAFYGLIPPKVGGRLLGLSAAAREHVADLDNTAGDQKPATNLPRTAITPSMHPSALLANSPPRPLRPESGLLSAVLQPGG